jgi:hypothetical protein
MMGGKVIPVMWSRFVKRLDEKYIDKILSIVNLRYILSILALGVPIVSVVVCGVLSFLQFRSAGSNYGVHKVAVEPAEDAVEEPTGDLIK